MMDPQFNPESDYSGYVTTLRLLLHDPVLQEVGLDESWSPEAQSTIVMLAQTLGYCRLFGITVPPDLDGSLPAPIAMTAAELILNVLQETDRDLDAYPELAQKLRTDEELQQLACDFLRIRMNAWASFVAIDEASLAADRDRVPEAESLSQKVLDAVSRLQAIDIAMQRDIELFSYAAKTRLLENWRRQLSEEYQLCLPWWLDGTLENVTSSMEDLTDEIAFPQGKYVTRNSSRRFRVEELRKYLAIRAIVDSGQAVGNDGSKVGPPDEIDWNVLTWRHPGDAHDLVAMLLPVDVKPGNDARGEDRDMCVIRIEGTNAGKLQGTPASLGGVHAVLEKSATSTGSVVVEAKLPCADIRLQNGRLSLYVNGERWLP